MEKKPSPGAEALARKLQDKLKTERPRWHRWLPLLLVIAFGSLALFAWLIYPQPDPPRLTITAVDALHVEGEPARVRAILEPQDAGAKFADFAALEVTFWAETPDAGAGDRHKATCSAAGEARATLEAAAATGIPFNARHVSPQKKYEALDRAAVFAWPKDGPILLVDAEETLADLEPDQWAKTNPLGIAVRPGAAAALKAAADKGHRIAYFAAHAAQAKDYRRVRGWLVEVKGAGPDALPRGPVLGRERFGANGPGVSAADARPQLLSATSQGFNGPIVAIVRTAEAAEQCLRAKIRPLAMGGGDFPDGVTRLKDWADLPTALK